MIINAPVFSVLSGKTGFFCCALGGCQEIIRISAGISGKVKRKFSWEVWVKNVMA
jgi:hypothetical protein